MVYLLFFITFSRALSPQSIGLCKVAEAMPILQTVGWKNCSVMTDAYQIPSYVIYNQGNAGIISIDYYSFRQTVSGFIPTEIGLISSLTILNIRDSGISGTIPKQLNNLSMLIVVNSSISGTLPFIASVSTRIDRTFMSGRIPVLRGTAVLINNLFTELTGFGPDCKSADVSNNRITGTIPSFSPVQLTFSAENNFITGTIPLLYGNMNSLIASNNLLTGGITGNSSGLTTVDLTNNSLTGNLDFITAKMQTLLLALNKITGTIPQNLNIGTLNCSHNQITGTIPTVNAQILDVSNNLLTGTIPRLTERLSYINLANNMLTGKLPLFGSVWMSYVNLSNNMLSGTIPLNILAYARMNQLDISGNRFYGCPPDEPIVLNCSYGGWFYSGCNFTSTVCQVFYNDTCQKGSGYYGPKCTPCNCNSGYLCDDGNQGTGRCKILDPCLNNTCEGYCITQGNSYSCMCSPPSYLNETDKRTCICPVGYYKSNSSCVTCPAIDNCFSRVICSNSVSMCETCKLGYTKHNNSCVPDDKCQFDSWMSWSNCSACDNGIRSRYRNLSVNNSALPSFCVPFLTETEACGFPCINTKISSQEAIVEYLYSSFTRWNWISNKLERNITITYNSDSISGVDSTFMLNSALWILPNVPKDRYTINNNSLVISGEPASKLPLIVVPFAVLLLLLTIYLLIHRNKNWVSQLPKELQSYYSEYTSWTKEGNFYIKRQSIDDNFLAIWRQLDTKNVNIKEVYRVCNPILGSSFANYREILKRRFLESPVIFMKRDWVLLDNNSERLHTIAAYEKLKEKFSWNADDPVSIIACVHGTDFSIAKSIVSKGFCALASLDAGYYGKGIYFTSSATYASSYYSNKDDPCIIVALGIFGNSYPVIEHPNSDNSMLGKPIVSGYQSHYVRTNNQGYPSISSNYDELVVAQECQVLPLFIVKVGENLIADMTEPLL